MKLQGKAMTYAIFAFAGCAITFFGYDTAVMSQVNINENYLQRMGIAGGTGRDAAALGGMVSLWFGGFAVGMLLDCNWRWSCLTCIRCFDRGLHCRFNWPLKDRPAGLSLGSPGSRAAGLRAEHDLAGLCSSY